MSKEEELLLEEVVIAYLKSSPDIKVESVSKEHIDSEIELTVKFRVPGDFGKALLYGLNNQFSAFFNKNNE